MDVAFRNAVARARREGGLFFAGLLSEDRILQAFGNARWKWQGWIYTPAITVWTFLSQCLSPDHSCRDAVARLMAWRLARGMHPCSAETVLVRHCLVTAAKRRYRHSQASSASHRLSSRSSIGTG